MEIMDLASFQTLVDRRYKEIKEERYADLTDQLPLWFSMETSDSFEEKRGAVGTLPPWTMFGNNLTYTRFYEQYNVTATHIEFHQALRWTRRMMDDDQTGIMRGDKFARMMDACIKTRQLHGNRIWNYMASNDQYFYVRSEGVPIASASHGTRTPGVSTATGFNNLTVAELAPATYRAARQQQRRFLDDAGYITGIVGDKLVVPIELEQRAMEILQSPGNPDNANRVNNPEAGTASILVPINMTSAVNWGIVNNAMMKDSCIWFDRVKPDYNSVIDFETFQLKVSGYGRWSFLVGDWRWVMWANVG